MFVIATHWDVPRMFLSHSVGEGWSEHLSAVCPQKCKEHSEWVCFDWMQCTYDFVNPFTVRKEVRLLINADLFLSAGGSVTPNPLLVLTTLVFARRLRGQIDAGLLTGFGNRPITAAGRPPRLQTAALYCYYGHKVRLLSFRKWSPGIQGRSCEFFAPPPPQTINRPADKRGCKYPLWDAGLIASRRVGRVGVGPGLGQRSTTGPLMSPQCRLNPPPPTTWLPPFLRKLFAFFCPVSLL